MEPSGPRVFRYDPERDAATDTRLRAADPADFSSIVTRRLELPSTGGVQVPLTITARKVKLTSPTGMVVTLHNRTGGSADNLRQTFTPANFNGQLSPGAWRLSVSDNASIDTGALDNWFLTITGAP